MGGGGQGDASPLRGGKENHRKDRIKGKGKIVERGKEGGRETKELISTPYTVDVVKSIAKCNYYHIIEGKFFTWCKLSRIIRLSQNYKLLKVLTAQLLLLYAGLCRKNRNYENFFWSLWWHFCKSLHPQKFPGMTHEVPHPLPSQTQIFG